MEIEHFEIKGPVLIKPRIFEDDRGYFYESFNARSFSNAGLESQFVQDNQSLSKAGALRGLHFQNPPYAQGKLIRVVSGSVLDVIVDIRTDSPTYGKSLSLEINSNNKFMLWIPPGFAHGFLTLENDTIFLYKCTEVYHQESESGIIWNDSDLNIKWPIKNPIVSNKDLLLAEFKNCNNKF